MGEENEREGRRGKETGGREKEKSGKGMVGDER